MFSSCCYHLSLPCLPLWFGQLCCTGYNWFVSVCPILYAPSFKSDLWPSFCCDLCRFLQSVSFCAGSKGLLSDRVVGSCCGCIAGDHALSQGPSLHFVRPCFLPSPWTLNHIRCSDKVMVPSTSPAQFHSPTSCGTFPTDSAPSTWSAKRFSIMSASPTICAITSHLPRKSSSFLTSSSFICQEMPPTALHQGPDPGRDQPVQHFHGGCAGNVSGSYSARVPMSSLARVRRVLVSHVMEEEGEEQEDQKDDRRGDGQQEAERRIAESQNNHIMSA